jgi:hypothetical protein
MVVEFGLNTSPSAPSFLIAHHAYPTPPQCGLAWNGRRKFFNPLNCRRAAKRMRLAHSVLRILLAKTDFGSADPLYKQAILWFTLIFDCAPDQSEAENPIFSRARQTSVAPFIYHCFLSGDPSFQVDLQQRICGQRLLFVTKSGRFGTGSLNIRPGDTVHYISGVPVPLFLRKRALSDEYEVVGPAMVDDNGPDERWQGRFRPTVLV